MPESIFKYYDLREEKLLRIISHKEIYFPPPINWEKDGEFEINFKYSSEEERRKDYRDRFEFSKLESHFETDKRQALIENGNGNVIGTEFENEFYFELICARYTLDKIKKNDRNFDLNNTGIFSTTIKEDSKNHWDNFGARGNGLCVEFNLERIVSYQQKKTAISWRFSSI